MEIWRPLHYTIERRRYFQPPNYISSPHPQDKIITTPLFLRFFTRRYRSPVTSPSSDCDAFNGPTDPKVVPTRPINRPRGRRVAPVSSADFSSGRRTANRVRSKISNVISTAITARVRPINGRTEMSTGTVISRTYRRRAHNRSIADFVSQSKALWLFPDR